MDTLFLPPSRGRRAFTLIELIAVLAVAAILLAAGVPGFRNLISAHRITLAANTMVVQLHLARSEAVKRGVPVVVCPSDNGRGCRDSQQWQEGFILFTDPNRNRQLDPFETLLRHVRPATGGIRITTSRSRRRLIYQPNGMPLGSTATITVCHPENLAEPRAVILSNPGRTRVARTRGDGGPLVCP